MDIETREYLDRLVALIEARTDALHAEMRQGDADTRREIIATRDALGALLEAYRHDLSAVAEGVAVNTEAIAELRTEMHDRFETVDLKLLALRLDLDALRPRP